MSIFWQADKENRNIWHHNEYTGSQYSYRIKTKLPFSPIIYSSNIIIENIINGS